MHYSCQSCLQRSGLLVLQPRRRLDTFTFQKICSLSLSACPGPSELCCALPITQPKFLGFSLTEALAGTPAFRCNSSSKYIVCSFTSLVFLKKQNSSTKCRPRGEKLFCKRRHTFVMKKKKKKSGEKKYRKSGCGSSWTFCEKTHRGPSFIFIS